jgi:branched-chain amino acid transport system permease protein
MGLQMQFVLDAVIAGILMGLIFSLIALGLTIIFGVMDIVNFAHGEFLMVGMYVAYWCYLLLGLDPILGLPVSAAAGIILGVASYYLLVRYILRGPMIAQLFGTFGLMLFIRYVALFFWGPDFRTVTEGWIIGKSTVVGGGIVFDMAKVAPALISIIAFVAVSYLINRTRIGKALKATALDAEAAGYMGIHTERMNALAWAIGGGTVGLAGALLVNFWYVTPEIGLLFVMIAFATVALGGFGSLKGAFYAGVIIGVLETLVGLRAPSYKFTVVYAAYFLIVVFRPQGLFGWKR